ncbi:ScbR family autoregulator-binding transcription factor [Streptomyces sp. NPDC058417]|uniref:ScbR family autoregulator-binding transcription factor n=1 Tax=unclassified Streptomyces TaxID=2593676 RepID=UPI0036695C17
MPPEQALDTQRRILTAAGALFAQYGYEGVSLSDVLHSACVSRRVLHHHYPDKAALARAVLSHQHTALVAPDYPVRLQALITLTHSYASALRHDPILRGAVGLSTEPGPYLTQAPYQGPINSVAALLSEASVRGELLPGVDPARSARFIVASYTGTQLLSQAATGRDDLHEQISVMWQHLLPALADPGLLPTLHTGPPSEAGRQAA